MTMNRNEQERAARADTRTATSGRLGRLDDLDDFEIADGEPDPRGWDVKTADGRKIGEVDSLIADTGAMQVRYLDIELDRKELDLDEDRHVLVPIGRAQLHDDDDAVTLGATSAETLRGLPAFEHGRIDRDYEQRVVRGFGATPSNDFYACDDFDQRRFFGRRRPADSRAGYFTSTRT